MASEMAGVSLEVKPIPVLKYTTGDWLVRFTKLQNGAPLAVAASNLFHEPMMDHRRIKVNHRNLCADESGWKRGHGEAAGRDSRVTWYGVEIHLQYGKRVIF